MRLDAIVEADDGCTTAATPSETGSKVSGPGGGAAGLLLLQKTDAELFALNPGELAAAVGEAGGRQQQKEFLQVDAFDRTLHREFGARLRDVLHHAVAPPGAVDSHHMRVDSAFKHDAVARAPFRRHILELQPSSGRPMRASQGRVAR